MELFNMFWLRIEDTIVPARATHTILTAVQVYHVAW